MQSQKKKKKNSYSSKTVILRYGWFHILNFVHTLSIHIFIVIVNYVFLCFLHYAFYISMVR